MTTYKKLNDWELAFQLQNQEDCIGVTENAVFPKKNKENYQPRTLIDQTLEFIDPTPNIHTLFVQFNAKYFQNVLLSVELKWSNRMTTCAGICSYHPRSRECIISLSAPLLKLRPRKDLIETLLHEMIHGYLFLTKNNRDRDGHGPEFQKHMHRINRDAGTNISIYHNFHDEVKLYQQHWWRCNGSCQKRSPYFGMVRRAMNRAPSKNDCWWAEHQLTCGGQFIKVKEPEPKVNPKKKKFNDPKDSPKSSGMAKWLVPSGTSNSGSPPLKGNITNTTKIFKVPTTTTNGITKLGNGASNDHEWGTGGHSSKSSTSRTNPSIPKSQNTTDGQKKLGNSANNVLGWGTGGPNLKSSTPRKKPVVPKSQNTADGLKKLGNSNNNIHGWGTSGPGSTSQSNVKTPITSSDSKFSCSGTLGGSNSGKSTLLDKFLTQNKVTSLTTRKTLKDTASAGQTSTHKYFTPNNDNATSSSKQKTEAKKVSCPICDKAVPENKINTHLDVCLTPRENDKSQRSVTIVPDKDGSTCPMCNTYFTLSKISSHIEKCLKTSKNVLKRPASDVIEIPDSPPRAGTSSPTQKCLVCGSVIDPGLTLNDHLEDCIGGMFNEETIICDSDDDEPSSKVEVESNQHQFPCPVCMKMVDQIYMNEHLDTCLLKS